MTVPEEVLQKPPYAPDLVETVRTDHQRARDMLADLRGAPGPAERRRLFRELSRALAVHEAAEEEIVYPLLASYGEGGPAVRAARLAEEREAKRLLTRMSRQELINPASPRFSRNIEELDRMVQAHAAAEEAEVLPFFTERESDTKLRILATAFDEAKATAPTRAHPRGPDHLPGLLATAPVLAVVDRLRDFARNRISR